MASSPLSISKPTYSTRHGFKSLSGMAMVHCLCLNNDELLSCVVGIPAFSFFFLKENISFFFFIMDKFSYILTRLTFITAKTALFVANIPVHDQ